MILVVDADPLIYRFALSCDSVATLGNSIRIDEDPSVAEEKLDEEIARLRRVAEEHGPVSRVLLALTCGPVFRRRVDPLYKAHRDPDSMPALFGAIREYAMRAYDCARYPGLEGDDVIGILATAPRAEPVAFASTDKDMASVPGLFLHARRDGSVDVEQITSDRADLRHLLQALEGDKVDGYAGCPGIGPKRAAEIAPKGWPAVLKTFAKKGLAADALRCARDARILRWADFDPGKGFRLWNPDDPECWIPHEDDRWGIVGTKEANTFLREAGYIMDGTQIDQPAESESKPSPVASSTDAAARGRSSPRALSPAPAPAALEPGEGMASGGAARNGGVVGASAGSAIPSPAAPVAPAAGPSGPPAGPFDLTPGPGAGSAAGGRMKLLVWGESGVGKTPLALHFPAPAVIDFEAGAYPYRDVFRFGLLPASTIEQLDAAIDFLASGQHAFRTVVVDSVSVMWEILQRKWSQTFLARNVGGKGFKKEFYQLQPSDWTHIKAEYRSIIRRLAMLGMNVVCIARSKNQVEASGGDFMKVVGETFDAEKGTNYLFDTVIRLDRFDPETGTLRGECLRDRWRRVQRGAFEVPFETFRTLVGGDHVDAAAEPVPMASEAQRARVLELARALGASDDVILERLRAIGANTLEELTEKAAETIIARMQAKLGATAAR